MAERVGFEPTVGLHLRLISSQVHSTTLPPLQMPLVVGKARRLAHAVASRKPPRDTFIQRLNFAVRLVLATALAFRK